METGGGDQVFVVATTTHSIMQPQVIFTPRTALSTPPATRYTKMCASSGFAVGAVGALWLLVGVLDSSIFDDERYNLLTHSIGATFAAGVFLFMSTTLLYPSRERVMVASSAGSCLYVAAAAILFLLAALMSLAAVLSDDEEDAREAETRSHDFMTRVAIPGGICLVVSAVLQLRFGIKWSKSLRSTAVSESDGVVACLYTRGSSAANAGGDDSVAPVFKPVVFNLAALVFLSFFVPFALYTLPASAYEVHRTADIPLAHLVREDDRNIAHWHAVVDNYSALNITCTGHDRRQHLVTWDREDHTFWISSNGRAPRNAAALMPSLNTTDLVRQVPLPSGQVHWQLVCHLASGLLMGSWNLTSFSYKGRGSDELVVTFPSQIAIKIAQNGSAVSMPGYGIGVGPPEPTFNSDYVSPARPWKPERSHSEWYVNARSRTLVVVPSFTLSFSAAEDSRVLRRELCFRADRGPYCSFSDVRDEFALAKEATVLLVVSVLVLVLDVAVAWRSYKSYAAKTAGGVHALMLEEAA